VDADEELVRSVARIKFPLEIQKLHSFFLTKDDLFDIVSTNIVTDNTAIERGTIDEKANSWHTSRHGDCQRPSAKRRLLHEYPWAPAGQAHRKL
jgi:hypothetical protein